MAFRTVTFALTIVAAVGCNSDTYPVTGKVTFEDGEPVSDARVVFRSKFEGEHITAFATTDENGEYSLTTWQTDDGAVPGEHKVIVTKPQQVDDQGSLLPPEIHQRYASYDTTPLKYTVDREKEINITVEHSQ